VRLRHDVRLEGELVLRHRGRVDVWLHADPPPQPQPPPSAGSPTIITSTFEGLTTAARATRMSYKLPQGKRIIVQITYLDEAGNPAVVETVAWSSSNPAVARATQDPSDITRAAVDGLEIGSGVQVNATADADLGSGTRELVTLFDLDVVGGEAVTGSIAVIGEPVDIPPEGARPDHTLPGDLPHPDQGLPGAQPHPDHTLPGDQPHVEPRGRR
jgi:hypothetical protein